MRKERKIITRILAVLLSLCMVMQTGIATYAADTRTSVDETDRDQQVVEQQAVELQTTEQQIAEQQIAEQQIAEQQVAEQQTAEQQASDQTDEVLKQENASVPENTEETEMAGVVPDQKTSAKSIYEDQDVIVQASSEAEQSYYKTAALPAIRNQNPYGTCWAFSSIGLLEINLMKQGKSMDLSEMHLVYFAYHSVDDPLGGLKGDEIRFIPANSKTVLTYGGNYSMAFNALKDWRGADSESDVPYFSSAAQVTSSGLPDGKAYNMAANMTGFYNIDATSRADIKNAVVEYGAVGINYYSSSGVNGKYYNSTTSSYYCPDALVHNHAVSIVGWDDNYSKDKFSTKPQGDGAWIIRNSWNTTFGDNGYFYLSYYDATIDPRGVAVTATPAGNYDHNYQYDGTIYGIGVNSQSNSVKAANVFTAKGNAAGAEQINAVSFETESTVNGNYTIRIYRGLTNTNNPESGTLCATQSGTTTYEGFYTVDLDNPVAISEGDTYSVVVDFKSNNGSNAYLAADYGMSTQYYTSTSSANAGQSFIYSYNSWSDYGARNHANIRIKAYTKNISKFTEKPVTGVKVDKSSETVNKGGTVQLSATVAPTDAYDKGVIWSSADEKIATVTSDGVVKGLAAGSVKITAKTRDGSYQASCTVRVLVPLNDIYMDMSYVTFQVGSTRQMSVNYSPLDTTDSKTVTWSSSDSSVAKVSSTGVVTGLKPGNTVITARVGSYTTTCSVTITQIYAYGLSWNSTPWSMNVGGSYQLGVTLYPANATNQTVTWSSSNTKVATVSSTGVVKAIAPGSVTITATSGDKRVSSSINMEIMAPLTAIFLDRSTLSLNEGGTQTLHIVYKPTNTTDGKAISWRSNAPSVANVDNQGKITAISAGTATITAFVNGKTASCVVTVKSTQSGIVIGSSGIFYYKSGVIDKSFTGMLLDQKTGKKYWFDSGVGARDKQVYDPTSNAWYWFDADGTMAKGKDVFVPKSNDNRREGKWVRYDKNGGMVKGWDRTDRGIYYFDPIEGTMQKGEVRIDDKICYFDQNTGIGLNGWNREGGKDYWYEQSIRQGYSSNAAYRGKEIYDPGSDAWYWLDNIQGGAKATGKDVYQDSSGGKWVRYDSNGAMAKGWNNNNFFDRVTGAMYKGWHNVDGVDIYFNEVTGKRM